jgi:hypothetical protein
MARRYRAILAIGVAPPNSVPREFATSINVGLGQDMAGRHVKKEYGQASNFRQIYAARFITSGFP